MMLALPWIHTEARSRALGSTWNLFFDDQTDDFATLRCMISECISRYAVLIEIESDARWTLVPALPKSAESLALRDRRD